MPYDCVFLCVCAWPTVRQFLVNNENDAKNIKQNSIEMKELIETMIMKMERN